MSALFGRCFGGIFTSQNPEMYNTIKLQPFHQAKIYRHESSRIQENEIKSGIVLVLDGINTYFYKTESK